VRAGRSGRTRRLGEATAHPSPGLRSKAERRWLFDDAMEDSSPGLRSRPGEVPSEARRRGAASVGRRPQHPRTTTSRHPCFVHRPRPDGPSGSLASLATHLLCSRACQGRDRHGRALSYSRSLAAPITRRSSRGRIRLCATPILPRGISTHASVPGGFRASWFRLGPKWVRPALPPVGLPADRRVSLDPTEWFACVGLLSA